MKPGRRRRARGVVRGAAGGGVTRGREVDGHVRGGDAEGRALEGDRERVENWARTEEGALAEGADLCGRDEEQQSRMASLSDFLKSFPGKSSVVGRALGMSSGLER